jgi:hypothetical protein
MPDSAGVVQEAGYPLLPSISTRHSLHEPKASRLSVAHNLGIDNPASAAALKTEVPSGTDTGTPSTNNSIKFSDGLSGVPKSLQTVVLIIFLQKI